MIDARHRWQARHLESASQAPPPASASLIQAFPLIPRPGAGSLALDLACGAGQNAVWLAAHGWATVAVDFSPAALDRAATLARSQGIKAVRGNLDQKPPRFDGLLLIEADLESCPLAQAAFGLVICFHYLDRNAFPRIERALAPGGYLLYETFTEMPSWDRHSCLSQRDRHSCLSAHSSAQHEFGEGPHSPEHLLRPGELRAAFPGLDTLFYREWCSGRALASLLARKRAS